ncbi:MAG TPA: quinone-dependent dihydroorotate dehydrogenase [Paenalcaligenes sp.]|nr:quinone-dependent dihydroorotate dehydrogenase [Paenalcaligenes sp.]
MNGLLTTLYPSLRKVLFRLPPERAHALSLKSLDWLYRAPGNRFWFPRPPSQDTEQSTPVELMGLRFPNRVGLAAGLDKNGAHIDALGALGFGFIEVGTVTPRAQAGNPQPRLFRLPEHESLINRFGFNNDGLQVFLENVQRSQWAQQGGLLGLNIGKNADTPIEKAVNDYLIGLRGVYPHADYITVNISSPNTKDLRALQEDQALKSLLMSLHDARLELSEQHQKSVPLVVKIAPDLSAAQIEHIATIVLESAFDGIIATNTTLERGAVLGHPHAGEAGGLSGPPVHELSLQVIEQLRQQCGPKFPIIGVGGINSAANAVEKIQAGADAVQLFTGFIYQGPRLIHDCVHALDGI